MKTKLVSLVLFVSSMLYSQTTIVEKYGKLQVKGNYIIGEKGDTVQLRGMSLFWSQWMGQYYNAETIKWLRDDWKNTVVRAAMGVDMGGYLENPIIEKEKVIAVVDAAIDLGIYVIIDYHAHEAHKNTDAAKKFFAEMAQKYDKYPNVIYEIYNEPLQDPTWSGDIKPYCEAVTAEIRKYDPDNLIVSGTRQWSQMVSEAANDPIKDVNMAYALHYYAGTHKKSLREEAEKAMAKGIALFVTEFGTCHASGNGVFNIEESKTWWAFLDKHKLSWCNWSVSNKDETASILKPEVTKVSGWTKEQITEPGHLVRNELLEKNTKIFESLKSATPKAEKSVESKTKKEKKAKKK